MTDRLDHILRIAAAIAGQSNLGRDRNGDNARQAAPRVARDAAIVADACLEVAENGLLEEAWIAGGGDTCKLFRNRRDALAWNQRHGFDAPITRVKIMGDDGK